MIPIGIITKNRPRELDATLRSLSASAIDESPVFVFDDGTDTVSGYCHLHRDYTHFVGVERWPAFDDVLPMDRYTESVQCLRGLVETVRITEDSVGEWNASCFALNYLANKFPAAEGFVLLNDDLVFKPEWFQVITSWATRQAGVIAGLSSRSDSLWRTINKVELISTQLIYISAEFYSKALQFFARPVSQRIGFDIALCEVAQDRGFPVELVSPFVARHIGFNSVRRPGVFHSLQNASDVPGPFAWSKVVRCFL